MSILQKLLSSTAVDWTFDRINSKHVPGGASEEPIRPNEKYVSVFLRSMRIVHTRKLWKKFYPVVHSYISLPHRSGHIAEFQVVASPSKLLELDGTRIDRVIAVNQRLLGPTPYRGGDLKMELGLFSVNSSDFAKPFLSILETMATTAGVSFVGAAKPFVDPLKKGIELLSGAKDLNLDIGVATDFDKPETGYFYVMGAPKGSLESEDLKVSSDYKLIERSGRAVSQYPYLLFSIDSSSKRDEWFVIPEISSAHKELYRLVGAAGKRAEIEDALQAFRRTVLTSPDLLTADAERLVAEVTKDVEAAVPASLTSATPSRKTGIKIRNLKSIDLFRDRFQA